MRTRPPPPLEQRRTDANESAITNARTTGSEASSPGQCAPAPSAAQKVPKVVSITPTANFIVFSGTRGSGARTSTPTTATSNERDAGAERRERDAALRAAERQDDERDLEAFEQDALEREREAVPVEPGALLVRGAARALPSPPRRSPSSSCERLVAARAQDRLAQPLQPKASRSPPTTRRRASIGMSVSAGPSARRSPRARPSPLRGR